MYLILQHKNAITVCLHVCIFESWHVSFNTVNLAF